VTYNIPTKGQNSNMPKDSEWLPTTIGSLEMLLVGRISGDVIFTNKYQTNQWKSWS
jgi:hypothetical protein